MKRLAQFLLLTVAATLPFAPTPAKAAVGSDEQTITQMENDWGVALVKRDLAVIDRVVAPEYMYTDPEGSLSTKAQTDADLKSGAMTYETFKLDELKVRIFGDTALVYGLDTEKSSYKGKDTSGQYRFTDVFVRRNGTWKAVNTHSSKVAKP